jgi:hypothetical protein
MQVYHQIGRFGSQLRQRSYILEKLMKMDLMFACGGKDGYMAVLFHLMERLSEYDATIPVVLPEL